MEEQKERGRKKEQQDMDKEGIGEGGRMEEQKRQGAIWNSKAGIKKEQEGGERKMVKEQEGGERKMVQERQGERRNRKGEG